MSPCLDDDLATASAVAVVTVRAVPRDPIPEIGDHPHESLDFGWMAQRRVVEVRRVVRPVVAEDRHGQQAADLALAASVAVAIPGSPSDL